jgi:putative CocE/NonD family hydrolase
LKGKTWVTAGLLGIGMSLGITAPALQTAPIAIDAAQLSQPRYPVRLQHNVKLRMRDGVDLSIDLYLPDAPGRFPTVLMRTPYNNTDADAFAAGKFYAERGYVYATQDTRGKYDSDGHFALYAHEANDGVDTIEWIAAQPWSNGKVGMTGGSYVGYVQLAAAVQQPKSLTAIAPSITTSDIYNGWTYIDGAAFLSFDIGWAAVNMNGRGMQFGPGYEWPRIYKHLPLMTQDEAAGQYNPGYRKLLENPRANDPFWLGISLEKEVHEISVPMLSVSGWYDIFLRGAIQDQIDVRARSPSALARQSTRLIIGPWMHTMVGQSDNNPDFPATGADRSVNFGPAATVNLRDVYLRWQDHWLKGIDNGVERDAPVKIFVMGENVWRDEQEWPLARTRYTKYYLASGGKANSAGGDGLLSTQTPRGAASDAFSYDPADPVPTLGGNLLDCARCMSVRWGPMNQAKVEARQDVLVYTTPVLTEAVEVTGPLKVKLYASTSGQDTDWTAKLVDVHPDGYAQNIQDGILRARYRQGKEAPASLLEPGKVYEYEIDLWATSNAFLPGHRIRLEISSSNFPRFDRNLNTGEDPMTGVRMEKAQQTIHHSAKYPSHIVLPIIPKG